MCTILGVGDGRYTGKRKNNKDPKLTRYFPKQQLHAHLSGSISRQCLHEVWLKRKENGETDLQDPLVEMPLGKHDYDLKT